MPRNRYLHELDNFSELLRIVSDESGIVPQLVEKDYWIMHCLFGLTQQGFQFELKGGTSLLKLEIMLITRSLSLNSQLTSILFKPGSMSCQVP